MPHEVTDRTRAGNDRDCRTDALDKESTALLKAVPGFEVVEKTGLDEAGLVQTIPGFNAVVVRSASKITRPVIEASSGLEIVVRAGIGLDSVGDYTPRATVGQSDVTAGPTEPNQKRRD